MNAKLVVGLMSGTSIDGIDAAVVKISEEADFSVELIEFISLPYSLEMRQLIMDCCDEKTGTVDQICRLNFQLGELLTESVIQVVKKAGLSLSEIDLIGSHGQTVYHDVSDPALISTLQIGSGAVLAERTKITTVSNFRQRDVAAGGEGAPLVPYVDHLLYSSSEFNRVLQNIGGIGNYTYLPRAATVEAVLGSDTGPGNMLIDGVISLLTGGSLRFDQDGVLASQGEVSENLLDRLMNHPFILQQAPKTTGREVFGQLYAEKVISWAKELKLSDADLLATVTAFTAYSIIDAYQRFIPGKIDQMIIGGGGSYNQTLLQMISQYGHQVFGQDLRVLTQEDLGFSSEAKEAVAFAVLAYQTMKGVANNMWKVTGANHPVILGDITPGHNFYKYLNW